MCGVLPRSTALDKALQLQIRTFRRKSTRPAVMLGFGDNGATINRRKGPCQQWQKRVCKGNPANSVYSQQSADEVG